MRHERPAVDASPHARAAIDPVLDRFGPGALRVAARAGMRIVHLAPRESYRDRSRAIRRLSSAIDDWPVPPAGLFVVQERTVYLRSTSVMTVAHEFAHALDCALGGGTYLSGLDPRVRRAFQSARGFVTPYAASRLDEYFAEGLRAFVEANDVASYWPRATKARLKKIDAGLYAYVDRLFRVEFDAAA
ncbi:MAG: hypothetical protein JOZ86_04725 [Candidatus Eremiobacteraeota bacterium]|nr:hypothetical protein [Candidatus Eremiobacteraeota bacterium]